MMLSQWHQVRINHLAAYAERTAATARDDGAEWAKCAAAWVAIESLYRAAGNEDQARAAGKIAHVYLETAADYA